MAMVGYRIAESRTSIFPYKWEVFYKQSEPSLDQVYSDGVALTLWGAKRAVNRISRKLERRLKQGGFIYKKQWEVGEGS